MAAYAALVSLMNDLELIPNHPTHSFSFDKIQITSLSQTVDFLTDFMESYDSHGCTRAAAEVLESEIATATLAAHDVIESHVVKQIRAGSTRSGKATSYFLLDLQRAISNMEFVKRKAMQFKAKSGLKVEQPTYPSSSAATSSEPLENNGMVGFDEVVLQLIEIHIGEPSNRRLVIPIAGMGGLGWPSTVTWWVVNIAGLAVMALLGKRLCISRELREEEEWLASNSRSSMKCVILDMTAVTGIDTSGIDPITELRRMLNQRSLKRAIHSMEFVKRKAMQFKAKNGLKATYSSPPPPPPPPATSSKPLKNSSGMVGFDEAILRLVEILAGPSNQRSVIPVAGMGGLGKTSLTKAVYEHSYVREQFDVRLWTRSACFCQMTGVGVVLL